MKKSKEIRKCPICKDYTFKEICTKCGSKTFIPIPPKFSPEDRWGDYRRKMKKDMSYKFLE